MEFMSKYLGSLGLLLTAVYIAFVYCLVGNPIPALKGAEINVLGDFLAGVFGPVAVFWLILGYFQQGRELKLQAEELRESVDQQRKQADVAEKQLQAMWAAQRYQANLEDRKAMPSLAVTALGASSGGILNLALEVRNSGATVSNVYVILTHNELCHIFDRFEDFGSGMTNRVQLLVKDVEDGRADIVLDINYMLATGSNAFESYSLAVRPTVGGLSNCSVDIRQTSRGVVKSAYEEQGQESNRSDTP